MKLLIVFIYTFAIAASGCISIPDTLTVEDRSDYFDSLPADNWCNPGVVNSQPSSTSAESQGFNSAGFSLLSWNIQKEKKEGWETDLVRFSEDADILTIQEAFLTEELRKLLDSRPYYWQLVTAFEYQQVKAGVLTAATIEPDFLCPLRAAEPFTSLPKTILITRYPLANTRLSLMIANIHMINFALDIAAFRDQARQMEENLLNYQGPMIIAGDFNTWSEERLSIIEDMSDRLNLALVDFKTDFARKAFGHTIDRVYYRGLTLEEARVIEVTSSDHNPLLVRFRLTDED
jgi:endonuclease/exonuclease/phosphatase (EEP) superfamily protein YafD